MVWCEVKLLSMVWFLSDLVVWGWGGLGWLGWWLGYKEVVSGCDWVVIVGRCRVERRRVGME
ncbi:unnamed protein product, partial [Prunus brigantina]